MDMSQAAVPLTALITVVVVLAVSALAERATRARSHAELDLQSRLLQSETELRHLYGRMAEVRASEAVHRASNMRLRAAIIDAGHVIAKQHETIMVMDSKMRDMAAG